MIDAFIHFPQELRVTVYTIYLALKRKIKLNQTELSNVFKQIVLYIKLLKFHRSYHFLEIVLGALFGTGFSISLSLVVGLIYLFLVFQPFYGAIYILNDLFDYKDDLRNPIKKTRLIASGRVPKSHALLFSMFVLCIFLLLSFFLSPTLAYFEIAFLIANILYTKFLKHITYIDSIGNAVTHPLRFVLGTFLFGDQVYILPALFILQVSIIQSILKRYKEMTNGEKGRRSLRGYSVEGIFCVVILSVINMFTMSFMETSFYRLPLIIFSIVLASVYLLYLSNKGFQKKFNFVFGG